MGLFGSAEAQSKKQSPIVKQLLGNSKTTNEAGSADPPTTPGDPTECAICGDPDNPNYAPFPHIKWSVAFNNKKSFFACDPRHWFGLGTDNPRSRIEIKGNISEDDGIRGLRLSYLNGTVCEDLMFEYGGGDDSYIGSLSPIDFHLRTANLPRLSISKTGKVGVNNNSGLAQFSVNGTTVLGNIESSHAASISANDVLITNKLSINTSGYENQLTVGGNAAIGYSAAAPENGLLVQGNIGIGTTTPTEKLEVNGTIKANNLKLTGLNNGLISNQNGTFGNATPEQVATLLGITGTEDYIPKFGTGTTLENSYIRQAGVDGRKCIGLGINDNSTFNLVENFHFSNFQTLHVDGGGSHFGFNTYSKLEGSNWTYPRLYTEINNTQLGASDIIQHADGRISFNNLKPTENPLTEWKTVMTMTPDRKVGIGVVEPLNELEVNGNIQVGGKSSVIGVGNQARLWFSGGQVKDATMGSENFDPLFVERFNEAGDKTTLRINVGDDGGNDKVEFGYYNDNSGWQQSAAVYANGEIWAREVNVVNYGTPYPDFVFKSGYKLPDLFEIENFIKKEGHLPNIPTEKEVGEKGINLGEMNKLLLQKIEEMTLHLIRMQKEIDELKKL